MSNRIKKFDGGGDVDGGGTFNILDLPLGPLTSQAAVDAYINSLPGADPNAFGPDEAVAPTTSSIGDDRKLTSEELRDIYAGNLTAGDIYGDPLAGYEGVRDPVTSFVSAAQASDYLQSILESGDYNVTPEELEARRLGLSVAQMNARTEDMLDSILKAQGETETGFVNESARLAAEGILRGKISQAGVTDPAAQEAALKSAMESLEGGASGIEAVKAAAGGAKDYVEDLLASAKEILDKGYDKVAASLPKGVLPDTIGIDPTTGQTTAVWGKTSGTPVLGGTVGSVGGGTYAGVTTTGNAALDAIIKAAKEGVNVESVIGAVTGLPSDVVDAAVQTAKEVGAQTVTGTKLDTDEKPKIVLTPGAGTGTDAVDTLLGGGVETVTGTEIIDPNSLNQILTVGDITKDDDEVVSDGGGKWVDTGAGTLDEVISGRIIGDPFDAGGGPDDKVVVDDKVIVDEEIGPRIIGDPLTFEEPPLPPILDEVPPEPPEPPLPPILEEVPPEPPLPPILEEVPPEPPPEVPEIPEAMQGYRAVQTKPGELVDIEYLYDITGPSIFAPKMEEEEKYSPLGMYSPYAEGGIVQDYDIEELIRFLESQRG